MALSFGSFGMVRIVFLVKATEEGENPEPIISIICLIQCKDINLNLIYFR